MTVQLVILTPERLGSVVQDGDRKSLGVPDVGVYAEPRYMTVSTREFASLLPLPLYLPYYVSAFTLSCVPLLS